MSDQAYKTFDYIEYRTSGSWQKTSGNVITEQPVGLTVNGKAWLTLVGSPSDLEALAVGFLYNEGIVSNLDEIADIRVCPTRENVDIWLNHPADQPEHWMRTSSCMGGMTIDKPSPVNEIGWDGERVEPLQIVQIFREFLASADMHNQAGGLHASALTDGKTILALVEDIGRHNTLDKIAGKILLEKIKPGKRIILTSGRVSSEMLQKSARLRAEVLISRTSPTSNSIMLAENWGITLIGYIRGDRFTVYSHPERINLHLDGKDDLLK